MFLLNGFHEWIAIAPLKMYADQMDLVGQICWKMANGQLLFLALIT